MRWRLWVDEWLQSCDHVTKLAWQININRLDHLRRIVRCRCDKAHLLDLPQRQALTTIVRANQDGYVARRDVEWRRTGCSTRAEADLCEAEGSKRLGQVRIPVRIALVGAARTVLWEHRSIRMLTQRVESMGVRLRLCGRGSLI